MGIKRLRSFTDEDIQKFDSLVTELKNTGTDAASFAKDCRTWFYRGDISGKERVRLVSWCNPSTDPRKRGREFAQKISKLVFGKVIDEYD